MDLYRVVPFKRLQQVAEQQALAFVSYRTFTDDPHEASLINSLMTQDGVKDVARVLTEHGENALDLMALIMAARNADASAFMQCWTKKPEYNLMWERYGDGPNAVRMRMTATGRANLPPWISSHEARYKEEFDIWSEIQEVRSTTDPASISTIVSSQSGVIDLRKSLTFKLATYDHENEIRLMTPVYNDMLVPGTRPQPAPWANQPNGNKNITLVPIGDISRVVESVMAGPRASDEFQRDVETFCKQHGLEYEGKSLLMTPKYTGSRKIFTADPDDAK